MKKSRSVKKKQTKRSKNYLMLLLFLAVCLAVGFFGSTVTVPAIPEWYAGLKKPLLNPPSFVFAPVWTTLYIMMAVAAWQIQSLKRKGNAELILFFTQLVANVAWTFLFFGKKLLLASFIEIIILWFLILATMLSFFKLKKSAGWLMAPYLAWVSFASYLTCAVWLLNR